MVPPGTPAWDELSSEASGEAFSSRVSHVQPLDFVRFPPRRNKHRIGGHLRYLGEVVVECKCVTQKDCAPRLIQFSRCPDRRKTRPPVGGGDLILASRDGAMSAAHEPAKSAAPRASATTAQGPQPRAVASAKDAPCEPVKSATTQPLATASQRLRGRPGRPRTKPRGDNPGDNREPARTQVRVPPARPAARPQDSPSWAPPGPRLVTRQQAAEYLNLSLDMIDRLTQQGDLRRVQLTLGDRTVRKVLYDRADLDRLVELSRIV